MRTIKSIAAVTLWVVCGLGAVCGQATAAARGGEDCGALLRLQIAHLQIDAAETIAAGTVIKPLQEAGLTAPTAGYCRVRATLRPRPDSTIGFEVWIPSNGAWNGKFQQIGNGGLAGTIPARYMYPALNAGYAVAATDDGHVGADFTDGRWALHAPEKVTDFGWRAIAETTVAAKHIVRSLKHTAPRRSYFYGCSDGGREALMMAQRYPEYFDGIVAGAAAAAMTRLFTGGALRAAHLPSRVTLSPAKLALLQRHALQACAQGGRFITDPRSCHVDLERLKCAAADGDSCLTEAQIAAAKLIYDDMQDPVTGRPMYGVMPGAEALQGSWDDWISGPNGDFKSAGLAITWNYLAFMVMSDPNLELARVTVEDLKRGAREVGAQIDSDEPNLAAFQAKGGKLLQYHGWNDPIVAPGYSLEYRDRLIAKLGPVEDFYRLYMIPGMLHCGGGDAPSKVDWQAKMVEWVEHGVAPDVVTAVDAHGATQSLRPVGVN